jgi:ATP-dependent Clp protease protease subunit
MTTSSIFISFVRPVDFNTASALLAAMNQAIKEGHADITLLMSSSGGQVIPGFAIYNQLLMLPITLTTCNIGSVNSIATIIFLAGARRLATPNATFLFHGTSWGFGHAAEIAKRQLAESISALEVDEKRMRDVVVMRTHIQETEIVQLMLDGMTRDAQFAKDREIIHEITTVPIAQGIPVIQI